MHYLKDKRLTIFIIIIIVIAIGILAVFGIGMLRQKETESVKEMKSYSRHYAFITNLDDRGEMWTEAYEGAKEYGLEHDAYVEWFGKNLVETYSKTELLEMAIAAKVDGIIVQGDDSSEMDKLVSKASKANIPLIAMWTDCYGSSRTAYVGMSSYNLGAQYCNYILEDSTEEDQTLLVLINTSNNDSSEKLVFAGLKETLYGVSVDKFKVKTVIVDDYGTYSIEESIRNLLLTGEKPADIVVCLDENTTSTMARLVVDYNKVGDFKLIGFYSSDSIVDSVANGVIDATLTIDGKSMGRECVISLDTYLQSGYGSEYVPIEILTITQKNVGGWKNE